jgi:O-antigen ligase
VHTAVREQWPGTMKRLLLTLEAAAIAWLIRTEDLTWFGPTLLVGIGSIAGIGLVLTAWPTGALILLVIGSAIPRMVWSVAGLHIHPEHLVILAAVAAIVIKRAYRDFRWSDLHIFDYLLIVYIALNFFSSVFTSPETDRTLRWAILQTIVILPYFLLRLLVRTREMLWKTWIALVITGGVASLYGCAAFLSNQIFGTSFGVETQQYGTIPGTYGTQYEANIFGSYAACAAIMFLVGLLMSRDPDRKLWIGGFLVAVFALVISMSRAVLLSFPVAVLVTFWMTAKAQHLETKRVVRITLLSATVLLLASPFLISMLQERFETLTDVSALTDDMTTAGRLIQTKVALDSIHDHPVFGTGTASFQLYFHWEDYGLEMGDTGGWLGNTPLRVLNDTGVAGLAAFLGFIGSLAWRFRKIAHFSDHRTRSALVALACGVVLYAMTFQATEATILAFTWIHLGLLATGLSIVQRDSLQSLF